MATHKVLRGVAHNFAHSFLGLGYWYIENSWPIQHLLMAARAAGEATLRINLLTGEIHPPSVSSTPLQKALSHVPETFRDVLERSGASASFVTSAALTITFRFAEKIPGKPSGHSFGAGVIVPEMVPYSARTTIVDDRGVVHEAAVREWWHN